MTKLYALLLLLACAGLPACKSASKAFDRGNYAEAIELSTRRLAKDPSDGEARHLLQTAYKYAVEQHQDAIRILNDSRDDDRYIRIHNHYVTLQHYYSLIRRTPAASAAAKPQDFSTSVETYRDKAVEALVTRANGYAAEGTKYASRQAYLQLREAERLKPSDIELRRLREQAYLDALTKVLVRTSEGYGSYASSGSSSMRNFWSNALRGAERSLGSSEFVRFYSESELHTSGVQPDQVLELTLARLDIGRPRDSRDTREVSKEVVVKEVQHKPDSVTKVWGKVTARLTTTERTMESEGDLMMVLRDPSGRQIWSDRARSEHRWKTRFASYSGDERALSQEDRELVKKNDQDTPDEDDIMQALLQNLESDLMSKLRSFYVNRRPSDY